MTGIGTNIDAAARAAGASAVDVATTMAQREALLDETVAQLVAESGGSRATIDARIGALLTREGFAFTEDEMRFAGALPRLPEPLRPNLPEPIGFALDEAYVLHSPYSTEQELMRLDVVRRTEALTVELGADPAAGRHTATERLLAIALLQPGARTTNDIRTAAALAGLPEPLRPALSPTTADGLVEAIHVIPTAGPTTRTMRSAEVDIAADRLASEPGLTVERTTAMLHDALQGDRDHLSRDAAFRIAVLSRLPDPLRPPLLGTPPVTPNLDLPGHYVRGLPAPPAPFLEFRELRRLRLLDTLSTDAGRAEQRAALARGERLGPRHVQALVDSGQLPELARGLPVDTVVASLDVESSPAHRAGLLQIVSNDLLSKPGVDRRSLTLQLRELLAIPEQNRTRTDLARVLAILEAPEPVRPLVAWSPIVERRDLRDAFFNQWTHPDLSELAVELRRDAMTERLATAAGRAELTAELATRTELDAATVRALLIERQSGGQPLLDPLRLTVYATQLLRESAASGRNVFTRDLRATTELARTIVPASEREQRIHTNLVAALDRATERLAGDTPGFSWQPDYADLGRAAASAKMLGIERAATERAAAAHAAADTVGDELSW